MEESFQFYVDFIPEWFMNKVSSNDIILMNCDYNKYDVEDAYCIVLQKDSFKIIVGGEYISKFDICSM